MGLLLASPFVSMAGSDSRQTDRPDLGISEFYTDTTTPEDGETINITVKVKNYEPVWSSSATIKVYEDVINPFSVVFEENIPPLHSGAEAWFGFPYDTTNQRGSKFFYAMITDVVPSESNATWKNNNATLEVNIFKDSESFDYIYSGNEIVDITGIKERQGFLALYDNAKATITEDGNGVCDFYLKQKTSYQYGIILADQSRLDIRDCSLYSNYPFYITVSDNAQLTITGSNITNATVRTQNTNVSASLTIDDSNINTGGLDVGAPWTVISGSYIEGDFLFSGGNVSIDTSEVYTDLYSWAEIEDTEMTVRETSFQSEHAPFLVIYATGTSKVFMYGVWDMGIEALGKQTVTFDAKDSATIRVHRHIEVHAKDTTDMPIDGASIEVYRENKGVMPAIISDVTDAVGNVTFELLSDIMVSGNDGYMGNYEFVAIFTDDRSVTHTTTVTYRFADIDDLSYNATHDKLTIMFEPIPPKICPNPYKPTGTLMLGQSLAYSGCIQITTTVKYINSTIKVLQDEDFQSAIYIESSGRLILENTTIWSNKRMNIYVIGGAAYLQSTVTIDSRSGIMANALVGVDGNVDMSTVEINANIRGKYKIFNVGTDSIISGTWLSEAATMNVFDTDIYSPDQTGTSVVRGGSLTIGGGDFFVTHFELNSTTNSAIDKSEMWGNSLTMDQDPEYRRWYLPGSSLRLVSEGNCQVINSNVNYDIFDMNCKAFNAEKSKFNRDIIYGEEATSGSLRSVDAPAVRVIGDATVKTYFYVSLQVTNALGGSIADAPITVTRMGGGTEDAPKPKSTKDDGTADFVLLAEKITTGNNHEWMGNYKMVIDGCSEADPLEFSVGGAEGDQHYDIQFDACVPDIEGLHYTILELNRTVIEPPAHDVKLKGQVRVTYEGGITLPPMDLVDISVFLPDSGDSIMTETSEDGDFELVFDMINKGLMPEEQLVVVNATYTDPSNPSEKYTMSQTLNISVLPEIPKMIRPPMVHPPTPGDSSLTDKDIYKAKEPIVVSGRAIYDTNTPVPAGSSVTVQIIGTTIVGSGTTGSNGIFVIALEEEMTIKPKKDTTYYIITKVTATHPFYTDLQMSAQKEDLIIIKGKEDVDPTPWFLIILLLIVVIIIAAVAGVLVYLRFKTWGTLVECGECGAFIPENATKCTKCGTEFETEVVKCSECEAWIPALATECPKCGVEFKKIEESAEDGEETPPPPVAPGAPGAQPPPPQPPKPKK